MPEAEINKAKRRRPSTPELVLYGSLLLIAFLAYLVPVDVLQKHPQLQPFVDFMASWNMQIRRVGEISGSRSQVNMFIYSMAWMLILIPIASTCRILLTEYRKTGFRPTQFSISKITFYSLLCLFLLRGIYLWPNTKLPLSSRIEHALFISPITSPIASVVLSFAVPFFLIMLILMFSGIILKISRHIKA